MVLAPTANRIVAALVAAVALVLVLASCGDASNDEAADEAPPEATVAVVTETTSPEASAQATEQPVSPAPVPSPSPTVATSPTATPEATPLPSPDCWSVEEFGDGSADRWRVVNDTVMGGQSDASLEFVDGAMRFSGNISTDGGGFSSVRYELPIDAMAGATQLRFRVRSDGRSYEVLADDVLDGRDFRVSHFGAIPLDGTGEWEEVAVLLDDLSPRVFGTPIDDAAFEPDLASLVGIILADGFDGPFLLEVDSIEACA